MKRSAALAGLMLTLAASGAVAQTRPLPFFGGRVPTPAPAPTSAQTQAASQQVCPAGSYSVVQAPDGSSVSILFNAFSAESAGPVRAARTTCRIEIPMTLPAGYGAQLSQVDYRGFARLETRQSAEIAVDYEVGRGNRAPRFSRRLQGAHDGDFLFSDRIAGVGRAGCGVRTAPVLAVNATLNVNPGGRTDAAMIALDSADAAGALHYRFNVQPCPRPTRPTDVAVLESE